MKKTTTKTIAGAFTRTPTCAPSFGTAQFGNNTRDAANVLATLKSRTLAEMPKNRRAPFTVSYHGDSTILLDASGQWASGQVPRGIAQALADSLNVKAWRPVLEIN